MDAAGTAAIAGGADGIQISTGADGNTIGGTSAGARNIVSGNFDDGMEIKSNNNVIQGNWIGLNAAGTAAVANADVGFVFSNTSATNTLGGTAAGAGNVISGNTSTGVIIQSTSGTGNIVQGNIVGLDPTATSAIANGVGGIRVGVNTQTIAARQPEPETSFPGTQESACELIPAPPSPGS